PAPWVLPLHTAVAGHWNVVSVLSWLCRRRSSEQRAAHPVGIQASRNGLVSGEVFLICQSGQPPLHRAQAPTRWLVSKLGPPAGGHHDACQEPASVDAAARSTERRQRSAHPS